MSSNSSGDHVGLPAHVREALDALAHEHPDGHRELLRLAGDLRVQIALPGEPCGVVFAGGSVHVVDGRVPVHDVLVTTDRRTVAAVLRGDLSLAEALDRDVLAVVGRLVDVVHALEVLISFVIASIHVPTQQRRLDSFVAVVAP